MPHTLHIKPRNPDRIHLLQITDTHIAREPGPTDFEGMDTYATLATVLEIAEAQPEMPDCMVLTGDLVDTPSPEAYGRLLELLRDRPYPVVSLPGNHDDPAMMTKILNVGALSTSRVIDFGAWRILMLNDWEAGNAGGRFSGTELEFLREELRTAGQVPVLICLHHQPVPIGSPWMDAMGLANGEEFLAATDTYNNVCGMVWGHIHQEFKVERHGIPLWGTPSTCVQFLPGARQYTVENRTPGFRSLDLFPDGKVESRVIRI